MPRRIGRKIDLAHPVMQRTMRGEVVLARTPAEVAQEMGLTVETLDTEVEQFPGTHQSKTIVWVPINPSPERLYALVLESADREDAFSDADIGLLRTVAASMGVALENARLFDETQRNARESSALSEVGRDLSSTLDLATVMDRIATHAKELLGAQNSAIFLPESDGSSLRAIVALGDLADELKPRRWRRAAASSAAYCRADGQDSSTTRLRIRAHCRSPAPSGATMNA